jgi:hypothetical protein
MLQIKVALFLMPFVLFVKAISRQLGISGAHLAAQIFKTHHEGTRTRHARTLF